MKQKIEKFTPHRVTKDYLAEKISILEKAKDLKQQGNVCRRRLDAFVDNKTEIDGVVINEVWSRMGYLVIQMGLCDEKHDKSAEAEELEGLIYKLSDWVDFMENQRRQAA